MSTRLRLETTLLVAMLAVGCQATPPATLTVSPAPVEQAASSAPATPAPAAPIATVALSGVAQAPVGISAIISTNGGGIISTNGGGVVPTGGGLYRVTALAEAPLASTTVYLADAKGEAYPGIAPVTTDASGRFTFPGVPRDLTVMVVAAAYDQAKKKPAFMRTLVNAGAAGGEVAINAASTIVTVDVVQGRTELGTFNPTAFQAATTATAAGLADADPPDFTDNAALRTRAATLAAANAQLKADLDATRQDLEALKAELQKLAEQLRQPPSPPPSAAPVATATPAPAATATPAPAPAATATPRPTPTPFQQVNQPQPQPCSSPIPHDLGIRATFTGYPLDVVVKAPNGTVVARCTVPAPGSFGQLSVPEGCSHSWEVLRGGTLLARIESWAVPVNAPKDIYPPF